MAYCFTATQPQAQSPPQSHPSKRNQHVAADIIKWIPWSGRTESSPSEQNTLLKPPPRPNKLNRSLAFQRWVLTTNITQVPTGTERRSIHAGETVFRP